MFEIAPLKIFIVEDFPVIRDGLVSLLNSQVGFSVVGQVATYDEARKQLKSDAVDVVILDLMMADGSDGLPFIEELRARRSTMPILVFSNHEEEVYAERAIRAGASGFLMKRETTAEMMVALRMVVAGQIYVSRVLASALARRAFSAEPEREGTGIDSFTDRELHVFRLIGEGCSPRRIAAQLGLSVKTIEAHRENIRMKLDVHTFAQMVELAVVWTNQRIERDGSSTSSFMPSI
ncbi:response regulator [Rariglobus hedericola]|uniref:Response regulator transcription factor n=1 Tax=Rariglobus hedericola TaxID=2597822 RepID=A0A556QR47_9BACT|nr:response regulator transcription factor [Rariglobus hedericola]TSJ79115.1 response regulator transcription factor [Rariglobus hedericola]